MKIGIQTWGSDGDIRPFLALAGGLRARGHDVTLVVTSVDNKDYSSYGRAMGFALSHVGRLEYDDTTLRRFQDKLVGTKNSLKQLEIILGLFFTPVVAEMFAASERLCRENDAVIGHSIHYPIQTAAERTGTPYATVMLNHAGVYSRHTPIYGVPNLGTWMNPVWWRLFHFIMDRALGPEINKLRHQSGLPPVDRIPDRVWISKQLNLLAVTSAICRKQTDWPEQHHVCGVFSMPNAAEAWTMPHELKRFLEAGPSPVYMTLGSMFSLDMSPGIVTKTLVQAVLLSGCRAIVQSRWDKIGDIPDHPQIYKIGTAPHQQIFPFCAAVVHHGGAGTTHAATQQGCPSIIIEHIADQGFFANELARLGVAPKMLHRRSLTAGKLARAIRTVLDHPEMKRRAEMLREIMRKEDGVRTAAELIEKHLV